MATVRGVIFDLFHTLTARESEWSDEPPTCDMLGVTRAHWDRILVDSSRWRLVGEVREPYEILHRLARIACPDITEERIREAHASRTRRFTQLFQRIPEQNLVTLRQLKRHGLKLALLSNADTFEHSVYQGCSLCELFDIEMFSCHVGHAKPDREIYEKCVDALGLPAEACVFVGDGGSDELAGARRAGLRAVFVSGVIEELWPERIPERIAAADHHIREIPELVPWIERETVP